METIKQEILAMLAGASWAFIIGQIVSIQTLSEIVLCMAVSIVAIKIYVFLEKYLRKS